MRQKGKLHGALKIAGVLIIAILVVIILLARKPVPEHVSYGLSFNTPYAEELGLDPRKVYDAFLDDLNVRKLRLAAHWSMVEPRDDVYNFEALDYQIKRAEEVGAEVIFAVGRRLPRWPECHIPEWIENASWEEQQKKLNEHITVVINRYKGSPAITHWQVENEPFLEVFAKEHCGEFDEAYFESEVALVRSLDPTRPLLVTDSGNLGTWSGAYKNGDAFGTSVYVYFWNPELGQFKTILPPWFYRVKENLMRLIYGDKPTILIELSAEPWLLEPIVDVDLATQYDRMDVEKFDDILEYARRTRFDEQYLWGGEWWYWLMLRGETEMWERGKELFNN